MSSLSMSLFVTLYVSEDSQTHLEHRLFSSISLEDFVGLQLSPSHRLNSPLPRCLIYLSNYSLFLYSVIFIFTSIHINNILSYWIHVEPNLYVAHPLARLSDRWPFIAVFLAFFAGQSFYLNNPVRRDHHCLPFWVHPSLHPAWVADSYSQPM